MAKKLTPAKAEEMLHNPPHGKPLTEKQRKFFGAVSSGAPAKLESGGKITCTCGHSWDKLDSSKKDSTVCHICGKNNMKEGGWLSKYDIPEAQNGIEGTMGGLTDKGFNYNGAWGGPSMQVGGEIPQAQDGKTVPFDEWYKTVPKDKNDTSSYNLRRAYELAPQKELDAFVNSDAHLHSAYENPQSGVWEFMKSKEHPTIQKELDWFNSKTHSAKNFRKNYNLDSSGNYYQYVPKKAMGGSMPGSVGFTYARTQGIPSKGPHRNQTDVTDASAQNGKAVSDNTRVKPIITDAAIHNIKHKGNWLNKIIADNVTAYGQFGSDDNFVAPNDKLAELSNKYSTIKNDLYKKYNYKYDRLSRKKMPEELRNELREASANQSKDLLKIGYDVKTKEKLNLPNVNPVEYNERLENYRKTGTILFPSFRPENINASQDALYIHQGLPQKYNSFTQSQYRPTNSKNKDQLYYSFSPNVEKEIVNDLFKYNNSDFIKSKDKSRQITGSHVAQASLKNFQYSKGKDEKGNYISYYDINDYDNPLDWVGDPFEIYGRIYYDEKTGKPKMQNGGEMSFYQNGLDWTPRNISRDGSEIKKDDNGYWNPENWGEPVEIGSNNITMRGLQEMGYNKPLLGISDTGDAQMMFPGEDYKFKGKKVTEYPIMQKGGRLPIYVDNPKDPRLKAYKDSLALYKQSVKKFGSERIQNILEEDEAYNKWVKQLPKKEQLEIKKFSVENRFPNLVKSKTVKGIKPVIWRGLMAVTDNPSTWNDASWIYKKPEQPVEYKKPETKKEEPKKPEAKKLQPRPQNTYEGSPVYSPGTGSGSPSALIGFANQKGDTSYIKPEDYERFAVPKYGKEYIESKTTKKKNGGWLEKYK